METVENAAQLHRAAKTVLAPMVRREQPLVAAAAAVVAAAVVLAPLLLRVPEPLSPRVPPSCSI